MGNAASQQSQDVPGALEGQGCTPTPRQIDQAFGTVVFMFKHGDDAEWLPTVLGMD